MYSSNDYLSACNIEKKILHNGGTNNIKVSIAEINKIESKKKKKTDTKIKNIHSYNSIIFNYTSMVFW